MTLDLDDTIAAIATAPGGALRGIVRISGPLAVTIAAQLFDGGASQGFSATRFATCRRGSMLLLGDLGQTPATLYLWPTSSSYTRQPSAELHLPGSRPLLEAALAQVCQS